MQAQETLFGLAYNVRMKKRRGYSIPLLGRLFLDDLWPQMGSTSPFWFRSAEKQQVKLAGNVAKQPKNSKISVSNNHKFLA
jgi:hypothetical protein